MPRPNWDPTSRVKVFAANAGGSSSVRVCRSPVMSRTTPDQEAATGVMRRSNVGSRLRSDLAARSVPPFHLQDRRQVEVSSAHSFAILVPVGQIVRVSSSMLIEGGKQCPVPQPRSFVRSADTSSP
jgi:hypothetical protein